MACLGNGEDNLVCRKLWLFFLSFFFGGLAEITKTDEYAHLAPEDFMLLRS